MKTATINKPDAPADRVTIPDYFNTDSLTTHRILSNLSFGFFAHHFGADADNKWKEAHPFYNSAHPSINYHLVSLKFIEKHFDLFASNQFQTGAGWGDYNKEKGIVEWVYSSGYRYETPVFNS